MTGASGARVHNMGRNNRTITLDQAKAPATRCEAQDEEHLRTVAIDSHFTDATPSQVIHMWETSRKERGQKLTQPEPRDDDMLTPRDVVGITGLSTACRSAQSSACSTMAGFRSRSICPHVASGATEGAPIVTRKSLVVEIGRPGLE
jgi:hypothetical protein